MANSTVATGNYSMVMAKNPDPDSPEAQRAYFWFLLSSTNGFDKSNSYRDALAKTLSPEQRDAAEAEATAWKPQKS